MLPVGAARALVARTPLAMRAPTAVSSATLLLAMCRNNLVLLRGGFGACRPAHRRWQLHAGCIERLFGGLFIGGVAPPPPASAWVWLEARRNLSRRRGLDREGGDQRATLSRRFHSSAMLD